MTRIRAAVSHAFNTPLTIEEVDLRAPETGEVEVTLEACAICHSDITYMDGGWGGTLPAVYGHEAAGRITAMGDDVKGYKPGDAVLVTLIRSCGACAPCASGAPVACNGDTSMTGPITLTDGTPVVQAMACGAFAEKVVVQANQLAPLPDDIAMDVASLLACGVITGIGAVVNSANLRPGQTAVVIGAGGVGLNAIQGARIAGAAKIIAVDMVEEKLDAAMEFGATHGVMATGEAWEQVRALTHGKMADAVFVTVGAVPAYQSAMNYLNAGGKMLMVGMPHNDSHITYEPASVAAYGQSMIGSKMGDVVLNRDIPWLIDLYQQGRLKLDELISRRWSLDQINEAIADTKSGAARRNVILFNKGS